MVNTKEKFLEYLTTILNFEECGKRFKVDTVKEDAIYGMFLTGHYAWDFSYVSGKFSVDCPYESIQTRSIEKFLDVCRKLDHQKLIEKFKEIKQLDIIRPGISQAVGEMGYIRSKDGSIQGVLTTRNIDGKTLYKIESDGVIHYCVDVHLMEHRYDEIKYKSYFDADLLKEFLLKSFPYHVRKDGESDDGDNLILRRGNGMRDIYLQFKPDCVEIDGFTHTLMVEAVANVYGKICLD